MVSQCAALRFVPLVIVAIFSPSAAQDTVPSPSALRARVAVCGRTSTAIDVPIAACGTSVPPTFTGTKIGNSEGFSWWVSQHYALRTDYAEARARHLLDRKSVV